MSLQAEFKKKFSGFALEGYFRERFIEERRYTKIGSWWDRKGENEIDLICEDEQHNRLDLFEVGNLLCLLG